MQAAADLYSAGEGWSAGDIGLALVTAVPQLIQQVPGKDGGVILVLQPVDGVLPVHDGLDVVCEQVDDSRVAEEVGGSCHVAVCFFCPVHILHSRKCSPIPQADLVQVVYDDTQKILMTLL